MNDHQVSERLSRIALMWPQSAKRWTSEEHASWDRVMRRHEAPEVDAALEWLKDNLTNSYVQPGQLAKRLRETVKPKSDGTGPKTWAQSSRDLFCLDAPDLAAKAHQINDEQWAILCAWWEWQVAHWFYGPTSPTPAARWLAWQRLADPGSNSSVDEYATLPGRPKPRDPNDGLTLHQKSWSLMRQAVDDWA